MKKKTPGLAHFLNFSCRVSSTRASLLKRIIFLLYRLESILFRNKHFWGDITKKHIFSWKPGSTLLLFIYFHIIDTFAIFRRDLLFAKLSKTYFFSKTLLM